MDNINVYVIKNANIEIIKKIKNYYKNYEIISNDKNKSNIYKYKNIKISIYKNKTILFQGKNLLNNINIIKNYIMKWENKEKKIKYYNNENKNYYDYYENNIIGNDEVGVGDIFGPLVVTSCYINKEMIKIIKNIPIKIKDSKKIKDSYILKIAPILKKIIFYKTKIINNYEYNNLYLKYKNSHKIKAIAHNYTLKRIIEKFNLLNYKYILIDQFVNKKKYFEYLKKEENIISNEKIFFETKAESKSFAVSCSSIISRYEFLKNIKKLENKYKIILPLGANNNVKKIANKYKEKFEKEKYYNFIKLHFNLKIKNK